MEYVALDLETTGLDATRDRVIEVGADAIMLAIAEELPEPMRGAYADLPALRQRLEGVVEPA
jgi:oligoribonuclease (3'-5' exoribonuclease)